MICNGETGLVMGEDIAQASKIPLVQPQHEKRFDSVAAQADKQGEGKFVALQTSV